MSSSATQSTPFPPLPVTAAGMCTSMGGLVAGCAASRAGIQRISEIPMPAMLEEEAMGNGESAVVEEGTGAHHEAERQAEVEDQGVVEDQEEDVAYSGHQVLNLPKGMAGLDRLAHLGASALHDLFSEFPEAGEGLGRLGLILCLPSGYLDWARASLEGEAEDAFSTGVFLDPTEGARIQELKSALIPALLSLVPDLPEPAWTGLVLEDQAGFAEGTARAAALLSQGRLDSCLLGGIDSRLDPDLLKAMEELGLLMTPDFPAGFIPAEAGGFILLQAPGAVPDPLAWVDAAAQGAEAVHRFSGAPPVGDSLTQTVRLGLGSGGSADTRLLVLGSLNGSPWNSNEWGYLLSRLRVLGAADHWFPVGSFGEAGASLGPLSACMAIRGFARDYAAADLALIVLSSESGRKGAVVLRRPAPTGGTT
jgi:3-oxoacyl-[acyl-carrier-protein] synthase-1